MAERSRFADRQSTIRASTKTRDGNTNLLRSFVYPYVRARKDTPVKPVSTVILAALCVAATGLSGTAVVLAQGAPMAQCQPGTPNCQQQNQPQHQKSKPGQNNPGQNGQPGRNSGQQAQGPGAQPRPQGQQAGQNHRPQGGHGDVNRAQNDHRAPRVGDSGRQGRPFQQASNSRFAPPPRGQEYRVLNDRLVLVDKTTLAIVSVLGLVSALSN